jgi:hypothetical protein
MNVGNLASGANGGWPQRIAAAWQKTVQAIIETGMLLVEAKKALPPGEFLHMIERELPFSPRTAQRLMSVAKDPVLSDATHVSHLPASWGTLYALSQLPAPLLAEKIADGTITPHLTRADVERKVLGKEKSKRSHQRLDHVKELRAEVERQKAEVERLRVLCHELEAARALSQDAEAAVKPVKVAQTHAPPSTQPVHQSGILGRADLIESQADAFARNIDTTAARMGHVDPIGIEAFAAEVATRVKQPAAAAVITAIARYLENKATVH